MPRRLRPFLTLAVMAWFGVVAVPAAGAAGVERYQVIDYTLEVDSVNDNSAYSHTFTIQYNSCNESVTGSGVAHHEGDGTETLSEFDLSDHILSFRSDYDFMTYTWYPSFTLNDDQTLTFHDGAGPDNVFAATGTWSMEATDYRDCAGAGNGKITICHVNGSTGAAPYPPGQNPTVNITYGRNITVAAQAYEAHIAHGDGEVQFNPIDNELVWVYGEAFGVAGNSDCAFNVPITPEGVSGGESSGAPDDSGNTDGVLEETTICHKGKKTLSVGDAAVTAHLGHGDAVGACP